MSRILIDAFNMSLARGTGIATYARGLVDACGSIGLETHVLYGESKGTSSDPLLREILFFDSSAEAIGPLRGLRRRARAALAMVRPRLERLSLSDYVIKRGLKDVLPNAHAFWNSHSVFEAAALHFRLTGRFLRLPNPHKVELAHWTYPVPIRLEGATNVYTIHDLVPLRLPYATLDNKGRFFRIVREICENADHVVTVSESARSDITALFPSVAGRLTNTYQAPTIPQSYLEVPLGEVAASINGLFGLGVGKYLLYYGAIEPKKNVGRLVEAYLASGVNIPLVLVGRVTPGSERDLQMLASPNNRTLVGKGDETETKRRIFHVDYLPFRQLVMLIRGATAITFPSVYEGFGLPLVEAMICGVPVLTSNFGAMREIAGDASLAVDPYDVRDISRGLLQISEDEGLRAQLIALGQARQARFSAEAYRHRLAGLYSSLLGQQMDVPTLAPHAVPGAN